MNQNFNGYIVDRTTEQNSPLENIIKVAAVGAFGVAAYRSGFLKKGISSALEFASKNYSGKVASFFKGTRRWLREEVSEDMSSSLVRANSFKEMTGLFSNHNRYIMWQQTKADLSDWGRSIRLEAEKGKDLASKSYELNHIQTEMIDNAKQVLNNFVTLSGNHKGYGDLMEQLTKENANDIGEIVEGIFKSSEYRLNKMKNQQIDDLIELFSMTDDIANNLERRTGYRKLRIKDVFEESNGKLMIKRDFEFMVKDQGHTSYNKDAREFIENFFLNPIAGNRSFNEIKNMTFDHSLLIGEKGLMDLRNINNDLMEFGQSLSSDFSLPFININPLRMFGADKMFNKQRNFAILNGHQAGVKGKLNNLLEETESMIYSAGKVYNLDGKEINEGVKYTLYNTNGAAAQHSIRKIWGLELAEFEDFTPKDGAFKYYKGKLGRFLNIGYQDTHPKAVNAFDMMSWPNLILGTIGKIVKPATRVTHKDIKNIFGNTDKLIQTPSSYVAIKKGVNPFKSGNVKEFLGQFPAGRRGNMDRRIFELTKKEWFNNDNLKDVTSHTLMMYRLTETLNGALATIGLGLNTKSLGSTQSVYYELITKRFMPIIVGKFAWDYANYEAENFGMAQPEDVAADAYVKTDLAWHKVKDTLGITQRAKRLKQLMPGSDQISGIPGLGWTDMSKTYEEKKQYWDEGEDPVRKGRYWSLGNTPFTGGKISYYRPNWYRRVKSDWQYTDTKYGSREEYFENAWLPTPRHPLAPIRHFFTDKYHYEEKHYYDRPYLISGTVGESIPFFGPTISSTIGKLIKPPKKMHLEYWNGQPDPMFQQMSSGRILPVAGVQGGVKVQQVPYTEEGELVYDDEGHIVGGGVPGAISGSNPINGMTIQKRIVSPNQSENFVVNTMSGQTTIYKSATPINIREFNQAIKNKAAKNMPGVSGLRGKPNVDRPTFLAELNNGDPTPIYQGIKTPYGLKNTIGQQYYRLTEQYGMWGFNMNSLTGDIGLDDQTIQSSQNMLDLKRGFWDLELGGLGGELSEIGRRFIPKQRFTDKQYNPIRNTMSDWMPDSSYFTDFQTGDPYTKVKMGEIRLPGQAYEKINGKRDIEKLSIGSSSLGKSREDIIKHLMNKDEYMDDTGKDIVNKGTLIHGLVQEHLGQAGMLIDAEREIKDEKNNIVGYYDGMIHDKTSIQGKSIIEVKTMTDEKYNKDEVFHEHRVQLNWYLHETGLSKGYLYYLPRDSYKTATPKVYEVYYDEDLYNSTMGKLQNARQYIWNGLESGKIKRGDLYSAFDRFKILADVAPYSDEFREARSMLNNIQLSEEQEAEKSEILGQVTSVKENLRLYPYRFKTANTERMNVTIDHVDNYNRIYTTRFPDNPISMAGIKVPTGKDDPTALEAKEYLDKLLMPGKRISIAVDADTMNMIKNNTYQSIDAVVYAGGTNVNRAMLRSGLATEEEDDYSPAAVEARFSATQRKFGEIFERIAHLDTIVNTKILQVRSPLESYQRRHLYGKDFQTWDEPFRDLLGPSFEQATARDSVLAIGSGALIGAAFGRGRYAGEVGSGNKFGRLIGALIGAGISAVGELNETRTQIATQTEWIPERRRDERELNEYIDMLKFVKNKRLFNLYAQKSMQEEGFDIRKYLSGEDTRGSGRQSEVTRLNNLKRILRKDGESSLDYVLSQIDTSETLESYSVDNVIKLLNKQIKVYQQYRDADKLPPLGLMALHFYQQSEQTMYGYDVGESIFNLMTSLPKTEKMYFNDFIRAPEEDKMEILKIVPKYMRRPLEASWGMPVEKKTNIVQYFSEHQLPGANWAGWNPNVSLDDVKIKLVQHQDLDPTDFNIWAEDMERAAQRNVPLPNYNRTVSRRESERRLYELLTKAGVEDLHIESMDSTQESTEINLTFDRRDEIQRYIDRHKEGILGLIF